MTISPEDWDKLDHLTKDEYRVLKSRDELMSQMSSCAAPQVIETVTVESERQLHHDLGFERRRKSRHLSDVLDWDNMETYERPPSGRALEDLVLECVDAGIDIELYL